MVLPTGHLNAPLEWGGGAPAFHIITTLSLYIYLMHSIPSTRLKFLSCHLYLFSLPRNRFLTALGYTTRTRRTPLFSSWIQMSLMLCCLLLPAFLSTLSRIFALYSTLTILDQKSFITLILTALSIFFSPKKENALHENSLHQVSLSSSYISLSNSSMLYHRCNCCCSCCYTGSWLLTLGLFI
jgi:hypothetical protein